ncbi:putative Ig domain-containing protein [Wielerella bovis]|nr:putative Ig domain-containing protein [Wielerella bovis]
MEGIAIKYALSGNLFTDEDIETLTYEVTLADGSALPSWLRYDEKSKTIIGIPQKDNVGQLALKVTAKDAEGLTTSINWNIVVEEKPNRAPIATVSNFISPIFKENEAITYTLPETLFIDDDVDPLTYHVQSANGEALPEWLNFDSKTRTLSGMPDFESAGFYPLRIIATDSKGLSSSMTWQLEVSDTNRAPTVENSIPTQNITAKEDWQYHLAVNNYFQDLDTDDELSYTVTLSDGTALPSWLHYDADTQTLSGNAPQKGQYHLAVTATDKAGETATQTLIVNVALPIVNNGGKNTIIASSANEILEGGTGSYTYVFSKGHGQDVIREGGHNDNDTIRFIDVASTEAKFRKDGNHLIIEGYNEQDSVRIQSFFESSYYQIETFQFSDKTVTLQEYFENGLTLTQTAGDDKVVGWNGKNILFGGDGNDTLTTYDKDDVLDGGAGDDVLNAGSGNDTLIGGAGNDTLNGGAGSDTYVFAKGHGQDVIREGGHNDNDTIRFIDVASTEAKFRKDGNHLIIEGYNEQDSVRIQSFFESSYYQIETFQFSDKTVTLQEYFENGLTLTQTTGDDTVKGWNGKNILFGGDGNDTLTTYDKDDVLDGGAGDDVLNAGSGNDTLIGGTGNDTLNGGAGSDTYVFAKGHGQDVIKDYGSESDVLVFSNVSLSEMNLYKQGSNLLLSHQDSQDTVLVNNFFSSTYYQVEKLVFEDQTVNLNATELNRVLSGANNMVNAMNAFGADMVSATNWQSDELKHIPTLLAVSV